MTNEMQSAIGCTGGELRETATVGLNWPVVEASTIRVKVTLGGSSFDMEGSEATVLPQLEKFYDMFLRISTVNAAAETIAKSVLAQMHGAKGN